VSSFDLVSFQTIQFRHIPEEFNKLPLSRDLDTRGSVVADGKNEAG